MLFVCKPTRRIVCERFIGAHRWDPKCCTLTSTAGKKSNQKRGKERPGTIVPTPPVTSNGSLQRKEPPTLSERTTYAAVPLYLAFRARSLTWFFCMQAPFSGLRIALAGKELETGCQVVVWTEGSGRSLSIFMIDLVALCSKSAMAHCKLKRQSACML